MAEITAKTPWKQHIGEVPLHLNYPENTMYEAVASIASQYPRNIAIDFLGKSTTYTQLLTAIDRCAAALCSLGILENDKVSIALPNCPQAVIMLYAINRIGAIANMIHPLSAEKEIEFFLKESESVAIITLDQFCSKIASCAKETNVKYVITTGIADTLSFPARIVFSVIAKSKKPGKQATDPVIRWRDFLKRGNSVKDISRTGSDPSVILYSGGTTGITKGIVLTNKNFNALGRQVIAAASTFTPGDKMLAAMPMFHGFGLGVCIHTMLSMGGRCVLVPKLTAEKYTIQLVKYQCNFIAGVPTLYEAMLRIPGFDKVRLSFLKGVFSGGDSLSIEQKRRIDKFLHEHGASVQVREGYGTTETVTACCLTPNHCSKDGSIGIPFPDTYIKIVKPGTDIELPYGEEGEILISGPTVMKEYLHHPDETAATLRAHSDGLTWVYTGDLGAMDQDGFVYFKDRLKRIIITGGFNVYPSQIENILDANEKVKMSCVIGEPDRFLKQKVKAFVTLMPGIPADAATKRELFAYCRAHIAAYALPYDIEFLDDMPKTLVGKIAYRQLEKEMHNDS